MSPRKVSIIYRIYSNRLNQMFHVLTNPILLHSVEVVRKSCAENYPKNFALIKLAKKIEAKVEEQKR